MREDKRDIFFVCGMHRSGTSFLAESLGEMGLQLPASDIIKGEDNPHGFFEPISIVQTHESFLKNEGFSWKAAILLQIKDLDINSFSEEIQQLKTNLVKEFPLEKPLVLKDPRLCVCLPLWHKIVKDLGVNDYYILTFRHPLAVAASLEKRNGMTPPHACLLWLSYLLESEFHTRTHNRTFVEFPSWINRGDDTMAKIQSDLQVTFPIQAGQLNIQKNFEPKLVHHVGVGQQLEQGSIASVAVEVYNLFQSLVSNPEDKAVMKKLDFMRESLKFYSIGFSDLIREFGKKLNLTKKREAEFIKLMNKSGTMQSQKLMGFADMDSGFCQELKREQERVVALEAEFASNCEQLRLAEQQLAEAHTRSTDLEVVVSQTEQQLKLSDEQLRESQLSHRKEFYTVWRPLYRNFYGGIGLILKKFVPQKIFQLIKRLTPNPDGVSSKLCYTPTASEAKISTLGFEETSFDSAPDIFILSIIPWDFRFQRPQQLATRLAKSNRRVFYIEMNFESTKEEVYKIDENLFKVRLSSFKFLKPYEGTVDTRSSERLIHSLYQLCDIVHATAHKQMIIQHPFWWQIAKHLSPEFELVYDCMDDISGFSNTNNHIVQLEHELIKECDKLVVSSQRLFDLYKDKNDPTIIRNAADIDHFVEGSVTTKTPFQLNDNSGETKDIIRAGYVGAIDTWFDVELLKQCAKSSPDIEFHLCGAVTAKEPESLNKLSNIFMYGEIPYSSVPDFIDKMDVMLIPFKLTPIIQACDPVKFYEHSAKGKPTVTTALPELDRVSHLTFVAASPEEFVERIHEAKLKCEDNKFVEQLKSFAFENTWEHRCVDLLEVCDKRKKVSIVVLSYGNPDFTIATLNSLYQGGAVYPNQEVLLVDNGSPEEALQQIREAIVEFPNITLIEVGENLGFAKGNNLGIKEATGDYILLLNNDTYVSPGSVNALVMHLEKNPHVGVVGPLTNNIGNEAKLFVSYSNMEEMVNIARKVTLGYRGRHSPVTVVAYFAAMFRSKDFEQFGLLSEEYGRGMFEDDDHCQVIKSKGFMCALAEDSFIHHHLSGTFSEVAEEERKELFDNNKQVFELKWGNWKMHEYRTERPTSSLEFSENT